MGFLTNYGDTIEYSKSEEARKIIKNHAKNFVLTWGINKYTDSDENIDGSNTDVEYFNPMFGYELEVHKTIFDHEKKKIHIDLSGQSFVYRQESNKLPEFIYQLEYGRWMIEGKNY